MLAAITSNADAISGIATILFIACLLQTPQESIGPGLKGELASNLFGLCTTRALATLPKIRMHDSAALFTHIV